MGYIKTIGIAALCGLANGSLFYVLGGVAHEIFAAVTPETLGAIGLFTAIGVALLKEESKEEKK